ncbi:MAG: glycosyltransferase family 4 protein, partial [Vulcanimicrobiaceae bacterium]
RETRRMSAGMRAYVRELAARLPLVAPDIDLRTVERGENFSFTEQVEIPFASRNADLVHFPTIFAPVVLPKAYVVTIHDLIHLRYPELFSRTTGAYYTIFVRRLIRGAARLIVGDWRTRDDLENFFGVGREQVSVVALGYDPALLPVPPRVGQRYLLYVGNHRAHKNLATLVMAWDKLPPDVDIDLVLTGVDDIELPRRHGGRKLVFLGDLTPENTAAAIRGATALIQPSLAEGFGLPVLEAIVRRIPVIAAEDAYPGFLKAFVGRFPALDVEALRLLLEEVATNPKRLRELAIEGEEVAREYTWDRFATKVAAVYRAAMEDVPVT